MVVKWAITNNCNLNCKHCYNANIRNKKDFIDCDTALRVVENLKKVMLLIFNFWVGNQRCIRICIRL